MRGLPWLLVVLVVGLAAGCGDDEEDEGSELVQACEAFCEAAADAGCPVPNCPGGCSYLEDQFGGCAGAYADLWSCAADGPVECVNGNPMPQGTECQPQAMALSTCIQEEPCREFCATADAAGCGGTACIDRCKADDAASTFCSFELDDLRECEVENGVTCQGGAPAPSEACSDRGRDFMACVASNEPCAAECMAAELAGCGGASRQACIDQCTSTLETSACSSQYQQLLYCHGQSGLMCDGTEIASTPECTGLQDSYDSCISTGG